jgi:hypothetical protein
VERLIESICQNRDRTAEEIRQAAIDDLRHHIGEQKVFDDITLVILKQKYPRRGDWAVSFSDHSSNHGGSYS